MFLLLIATSPVLVVMEACIMRELQELQEKGAKVQIYFQKNCRGAYSCTYCKTEIVVGICDQKWF